MGLRETREMYHLSQTRAAQIVHIPLRTYVRYENDDQYGNSLKRDAIIRKINDECEITETKGLLTIDDIKQAVSQVADGKYKDGIDFCFLFGSYAKGKATEKSDVDLFVSTSLKGLHYMGFYSALRDALHKDLDLVRAEDVEGNSEFLKEILITGIKIYGKSKE